MLKEHLRLLYFNLFVTLITMSSTQLIAQSYYVLTGANNGWQSYNGNYYKESYQILSRPVYKHATNTYYLYFDLTFSAIWLIDNDTNGSTTAFYKWSNNDYPPVGKYEIDFAYDSNEPTLAKVLNAQITFTDGSSFTPNISKGSANQILGRFQLSGDETGALLTAASIKINGTRSGLSNLKLWESADAVFNSVSDTQLGSTIAIDPGDGHSVGYSGFSSSITTSGIYYFLTADMATEASGIMQSIIVNNTNLGITSGSLSGVIDNAPLANGDVSLPVSLISFSANINGNFIVLQWITGSETDNLGFILERAEGNSAWQSIASYQTHPALKGRGNASTFTTYTLFDNDVTAGTQYRYRLSDVTASGALTLHSPVSITMTALPNTTELLTAYPNPFNPVTNIHYKLAGETAVTIIIYDMLGRVVKTLLDQHQAAGEYDLVWNGRQDAGGQVSSGTYLIRMQSQLGTRTQKILLLQ
ncbi:MAG TPA: FlgD immunoglobulin-like domain containing protein [bacterium]|nr:FlgD immunoglobulin-like domain containing protein [bacterium]HPN44692.1 FlgD immunoglobulin-like domain containing protein [bacterium]